MTGYIRSSDYKIPKFVHDEEVWNYVINKYYEKSGDTPDEYTRGSWMAINKYYQNAVRKYRHVPAHSGVPTVAWSNVKPCVNCDQLAEHAEDDYVCLECREKMS